METFDRRELLERVGGAALAAFLLGGDAAWGALEASAPRDRRLRELDRAIRGSVVERGSTGYGRARLVFNTRFDAILPQAVVFPESAEDVARIVRWARAPRHPHRSALRRP